MATHGVMTALSATVIAVTDSTASKTKTPRYSRTIAAVAVMSVVWVRDNFGVSHYFSSAEQLITAAFRAAAEADFTEARSRVDAIVGAVDKIAALMDYVLDDTSVDASALWLDAWSLGRRNPALAAAANELTQQWLSWIGELVRWGQADGTFGPGDPDVAARRLLTMIDGLGTQQVVRAVAAAELKHIAGAYVASELGLSESRTAQPRH
jgi:AcrR family transcriptional regulator